MRRAPFLPALLALLACDPPPVSPSADARQNARSAHIEGTLVASTAARGNAVVLLYDAARPPPPTGTGRPLTFTVVERDTLFGGAAAGDLGPFTAPFTFPLVPPGNYLVRAMVDANADWNPWYAVTNEPNAGDVGGAAADPVTRVPKVVTVGVTDAGWPVAVTDLPVAISDTLKVPVDRPAFEVRDAGSLTLPATPVAVDLVVKPLSGLVAEAAPVFLAALVDSNGDGLPDDANGDGVPDFWPRVVVRKLSDQSVLLDENDLDKNGVLDTADGGFADYEHVNPLNGSVIPADGKPDLVVLKAGFDFTSLLPVLLNPDGGVKATPTPVTSLRLVLYPTALDVSTGSPAPLRTVPAGRYSVTVIQSTGQTWKVPNELLPALATPLGLTPVPSQGFMVVVP